MEKLSILIPLYCAITFNIFILLTVNKYCQDCKNRGKDIEQPIYESEELEGNDVSPSTEYDERRLQREEAFNKRIEGLQEELNARVTGIQPEVSEGTYNLPHGDIKGVYDDDGYEETSL